MPEHIIGFELFFGGGVRGLATNKIAFCVLLVQSLLPFSHITSPGNPTFSTFHNFKDVIQTFDSPLLSFIDTSLPADIYLCLSSQVSLLTVTLGFLSFFAPAICFNCRDKVNGLTNVCVAEILWAIFRPCGGTYYDCTFLFVCVASAVTGAFPVFDLGSWANSSPKAWHEGWRNSAPFRVVCVKVLPSRCIIAASVWPQSNVRICYMVGKAAPHMAPPMENGLGGGCARGSKSSGDMFGQFTLRTQGNSRGEGMICTNTRSYNQYLPSTNLCLEQIKCTQM